MLAGESSIRPLPFARPVRARRIIIRIPVTAAASVSAPVPVVVEVSRTRSPYLSAMSVLHYLNVDMALLRRVASFPAVGFEQEINDQLRHRDGIGRRANRDGRMDLGDFDPVAHAMDFTPA